MNYANKDLRILMIETDLTAKELAELMGVSPGTLSGWLNNHNLKRTTRRKILNKLEEVKNEQSNLKRKFDEGY